MLSHTVGPLSGLKDLKHLLYIMSIKEIIVHEFRELQRSWKMGSPIELMNVWGL